MNTTNLAERVASVLEALAEAADNAGMESLTREIRSERLPALREGKLSMVVLGEFNHGKSSVINALLGADVLPTGITPTTSVITHIQRGTGPATAVRESGMETLDNEALRQLVSHDATNDLQHVEVQVDAPFLSEGLVIVDTPGVNDISRQKVEITYGYVPRADVVVYVLDATQALKRSEINFIENRLIKNSHDRLFFILGKIDALSDEELVEVETHVRARLQEIIGDVALFPLSARRALKGSDTGFESFREAISAYVHDQRDDIVFEGGVRTGLRLASVIDQSLAIEQGALSLDAEELQRRVEAARSKLDKSRSMIAENIALIDRKTTELLAVSRENARVFTRDFAAALPREIGRASGDDIKRHLPDFIHDTFKEWLEAEGSYLAGQLEMLAEEIIEVTNRNMREVMTQVHEELGARTRSLNLEVDTLGYDVGVFALGALGVSFLVFSNVLVGGLLTLAAPVLAFALKGKVDAIIRDKATEEGLAAIDRAGTQVEEEFGRIVQDFSNRLKQFVEDAGERLYRQVSEALDRVLAIRKERSVPQAELDARLTSIREQVARSREALLELKSSRSDAESP